MNTNKGARRGLTGYGLLAFDVGVGKTFTALAIVALARQKDRAHKPVFLVPAVMSTRWREQEKCE